MSSRLRDLLPSCLSPDHVSWHNARVDLRDLMERAELLNLPQLKRDRPDWTDRLPPVFGPQSPAARPHVKWHWSFYLPLSICQNYDLWRLRRRHQRNLEQIGIDELAEVSEQACVDDSSDLIASIYEKHAARRAASRFFVATRESDRLERLASRWDVDTPEMIQRGEVDEAAIAQVRRAIREARWTFTERCAKTLIPILSLLVALAALLLK